MGNFLKIIINILDDIDSKYFFANHKANEEERYQSTKTMFKDIGDFELYEIVNIDADLLPNETYLYPICCLQNLYGLMKNEPEKLFNQKIINFLNNKKFLILLVNDVEFEDYQTFRLLDDYVKKNNINGSQIYLYNNNSKIEDYIKLHNSQINYQRSISLHKFVVKNMIQYESNFILDKDFLFMSHNRTVRPHRYALLCLLKKNNLLDDVDWSLVQGWFYKKDLKLNGPNYVTDFYSKVLENSEILDLTKEIEYFGNIDFKKSVYEENCTFGNIGEDFPEINYNMMFEINGYSKSYINITTETLFERDEIHITEKSLKPFYFYQIPIFVASFGHIEKLKKYYNLDTFDDLINHSYDLESNPKKRLQMILNEIKLLKSNKKNVIKFYEQNKHRFLSNKNKVEEILNNKMDVNFFEGLING